MRTAMVAVLTAVFSLMVVSPGFADIDVPVNPDLAFTDINVAVSSDLTKIVITGPGGNWSHECSFIEGKVEWANTMNLTINFYTEAALKELSKKEKVYVTPLKGVVLPCGLVYIVVNKNPDISHPDAYYAWPVYFFKSGLGTKYADRIIRHVGIAPFGPDAVKEMNEKGVLFVPSK